MHGPTGAGLDLQPGAAVRWGMDDDVATEGLVFLCGRGQLRLVSPGRDDVVLNVEAGDKILFVDGAESLRFALILSNDEPAGGG